VGILLNWLSPDVGLLIVCNSYRLSGRRLAADRAVGKPEFGREKRHDGDMS
jgi:hypothetical protein